MYIRGGYGPWSPDDLDQAGLTATEVVAPDNTRTDLECVELGRAAPAVVVEAKIGAALTTRQLSTYAGQEFQRQAMSARDR